jgi:hypothetical protein
MGESGVEDKPKRQRCRGVTSSRKASSNILAIRGRGVPTQKIQDQLLKEAGLVLEEGMGRSRGDRQLRLGQQACQLERLLDAKEFVAIAHQHQTGRVDGGQFLGAIGEWLHPHGPDLCEQLSPVLGVLMGSVQPAIARDHRRAFRSDTIEIGLRQGSAGVDREKPPHASEVMGHHLAGSCQGRKAPHSPLFLTFSVTFILPPSVAYV